MAVTETELLGLVGMIYEAATDEGGLSRRHITPNAISAEMVRTTLRAEIFLPETPHRFRRLARTFADGV